MMNSQLSNWYEIVLDFVYLSWFVKWTNVAMLTLTLIQDKGSIL